MLNKVRKVSSHATRYFTDKTSEVKKSILSIAKLLRRRTQQSWDDINSITEDVTSITETVCQQAKSVIHSANDKGRTSVRHLKEKLQQAVEITEILVAQAKEVVSGNRVIPDRVVSFFDSEARPITG